MPAAPTNGTVAILFGDLSLASTIGVRKGIVISSSKERYFEYRQVAIQATERFCINNHDLGDTSTAGPLVALVGTT
jgi:HK97 family phage major capsid protein